jgi:hypothetical protein
MPIAMPAKKPAVPEGFYGRGLPDVTCEASHFGPRHQVGILCGRVECRDDVELLGLDRDGDAEWADLEHALGCELPPTLSSKGDRHRFYWLPAGLDIDQCNRIAGLTIDTRSHAGGYFREPWEWDQPFSLGAVVDFPDPDALARLSGTTRARAAAPSSEPTRAPDDIPDLSALTPHFAPAGHSDGRYVVMRAIGGWLAQHGYHPDAIAEAVMQYVPTDQPVRRGREAADAARQLYAGGPHPPGWRELGERFGDDVRAEVEHTVLDPVAEAWALRYAERRAEPTLKAPAEAPNRLAVASDLDALGALPLWAQAHVLAAQEELRTPLALNVASALGALACAVSGRVTVRIHSSYACHTCLFVCTVADPGEVKSAAFNRALGPIVAWEAAQSRDDAERYTRAKVARAELEEQVKALEKERKRGFLADDAPEPSDDLLRLHIKLAEPPPVPFRAIVGDVTSEKLADMLAQHGRLICLSSDAGKIFSVLGGQYSGGAADLSVWLEAYDGRSAPVDRMGREAERPRHDHTTLSCVLSTQPSVLEAITGNGAMTGQGFVHRFCWVLCDSVPRRWAPGERVQPMPGEVAKAYGEGVDGMLALPVGTEAAFSPEAEDAYIAWRDELEARKVSELGGELKGWAGKHLERTARIAAVLWAADGAQGPITGAHFGRAVVLGRWLIPHAVRALVGGDTDLLEAKVVAVVEKLGGRASKRQIARVAPRTVRASKVLDGLLAGLVERGVLDLAGKVYVVPTP